MPLYVMATPIGTSSDLSTRAIDTLKRCTHVIGEDHKNTSRFLKSCGAQEGREIYVLNEHTREKDLPELVELAAAHEVALISDCGTPGFCDPGADLVRLCRARNISVKSVPGVSSLMTFLSVCGHRLDRFHFRGFLPAETGQRQAELKSLKTAREPQIIMDTPYRLKKLLGDIEAILPEKKIVLGLELSTENETVLEGLAKDVLASLKVEKTEFVLAILGPKSIK